MRLQLTIQRHALPPTSLLWTVQAQDPISTSSHVAATISQLLEDVNDIIQLESDDWGLEDYVVEVGGYECLHFLPVVSVLKEDDVVTIRPLQTSDLKIRKIGGRHQISADGKHLFDGVAFGRPYLRKTARPVFRIPPRKRRKLDVGHLQYIEDSSSVHPLLARTELAHGLISEVGGEYRNQKSDNDSTLQLVTRQYFEDDSDSDSESYFEVNQAEESMELSEELKALLEDDPLEPADEQNGKTDEVTGAATGTTFPSRVARHAKMKERRSQRASSPKISSSSGGPNISSIFTKSFPDKSRLSSAISDPGVQTNKGRMSKDMQGWPLQAVDEFHGDSQSSDEEYSETTSRNDISSSDVSSSVVASTSSASDSESESSTSSDSSTATATTSSSRPRPRPHLALSIE